MSRITFGGGRELSVKIGMPNGLHKGAGLHRLTFPAEFDARNTIGGGVPLTLNVHAWLGASRGDWLGPLLTDEQIVTFDGLPFSANLVLALSDEQLAVIEQRRAGSDLTIWLTGYIVLGYDPAVTGRSTASGQLAGSRSAAGSSGAASRLGAGLRSAGAHRLSRSSASGGEGRNRLAGVAMSSDWCGRSWLYSRRQASTAA